MVYTRSTFRAAEAFALDPEFGTRIKFSTNLVLTVLTSFETFLYEVMFTGQTQSPISPILVHYLVYLQYCRYEIGAPN